MNKIYSLFILIFLPLLAIADDKKINIVTKQIHKYECALNSSNIDNIMSLYHHDSVFITPYNEPAIGKNKIKNIYIDIFHDVTFDLLLKLDEVHIMSQTWAYAYAHTNGTKKIQTNNKMSTSTFKNQDFFLLHLDYDKKWRIFRHVITNTEYMY